MIPYTSSLFFYILSFFIVGAIILGYTEKKIKIYGFIVTIVFDFIIFSSLYEVQQLIIYFIFAYVTSFLYLKIGKFKNFYINSISILLSLLPMLLSKFSGTHNLVSFLGLSYVTFRHISVLYAIRFKRVKSINFIDFTYFMLFFSTISAGPIDRYEKFLKSANKDLSREEYYEMLKEGIWKFMNGLLYSFVFASFINSFWLSKTIISGNKISYMYAYTFYLFFNFAGYSRMATGVGYMFGIKVTENFNMPFLSVDIKDFWSRWHISLSNFFRDFVYSRLVLTAMQKNVIENKYVISYIANVVTMLIMGLWHGFELHFVIYGLYHGLLAMFNEMLDNKSAKFKQFKKSKYGSLVCAVITFNLVAFGLLIFSGQLI